MNQQKHLCHDNPFEKIDINNDMTGIWCVNMPFSHHHWYPLTLAYVNPLLGTYNNPIVIHIPINFSAHSHIFTSLVAWNSCLCGKDAGEDQITHPKANGEAVRRRGRTLPVVSLPRQKHSKDNEKNVTSPGEIGIYTGWWWNNPSDKYELVSWDDDIPNMWKNKTCSKPPTSDLYVISQENHGFSWTNIWGLIVDSS